MQRPDYDPYDERMKELDRFNRSANRLLTVARVLIILSIAYWLLAVVRSWL